MYGAFRAGLFARGNEMQVGDHLGDERGVVKIIRPVMLRARGAAGVDLLDLPLRRSALQADVAERSCRLLRSMKRYRFSAESQLLFINSIRSTVVIARSFGRAGAIQSQSSAAAINTASIRECTPA